MKKFLIFGLALISQCAYASPGLEPSEITTKIEENICILNITGRVDRHTLTEFQKQNDFVRNSPCTEKQVVLNSFGGIVEIGYEIGKIVRKEGYNTLVKSTAFCNSACTLIFIAGVERIIEIEAISTHRYSKIGFHAYKYNGTCVKTKIDSNLVEEKFIPVQLKTYNYAASMLGKENGIKFGYITFAIDCNAMGYVPPRLLAEWNFATIIKQ